MNENRRKSMIPNIDGRGMKEYVIALEKLRDNLTELIDDIFNMDKEYDWKKSILMMLVCGVVLVVSVSCMVMGQISKVTIFLFGGYMLIMLFSLVFEMIFYCIKNMVLWHLAKPIMVGWFSILFFLVYIPVALVITIIFSLRSVYAGEIGNHLPDFFMGVGMSLTASLVYISLFIKYNAAVHVISKNEGAFLFWILLLFIIGVTFLLVMRFLLKSQKNAYRNIILESRTLLMGVCFLLMLMFYATGDHIKADEYFFYQQGVNAATILLLFFSVQDRIENRNNKENADDF